MGTDPNNENPKVDTDESSGLEQEPKPEKGNEQVIEVGVVGVDDQGDDDSNNESNSNGKDQIDEPEVLSELEVAQREAEDYKDQWMRGAAELDNLRKRMARDRIDLTKRAAEDLIRELLSPIDNLERALKHVEDVDGGESNDKSNNESSSEDSVEGFRTGIEMIFQEFTALLARRGVEVVDDTGHPFDPALHEALMSMADQSVPADHIIQAVERGYKMGDRLLRPAKVIVSTGPADQKASEKADEELDK